MDLGTPFIFFILYIFTLIRNGNCAVPVFVTPGTNYGTTITISEDSIVGTSIITAVATDASGHTLTYSENSGKFEFDGDILKTSSTFDYENSGDRSHSIQLTVRDNIPNYAYMNMFVAISDVNDNPPLFSPAVYTASVAENTGSGQALVALSCSDPDVSVNGACSLSIVAGDDGTAKFSLSGTTIQTTGNAIDYETHSHRYVLRVEATETPSGSYTGTAYVIITVTAVNEVSPSITSISPTSVSLSENFDVSLGTVICTIYASDADDEPAGDLVFTISSGNINNVFGISSSSTTAYLYVVKSLDYEGRDSYSLIVQVQDAAASSLSGTYPVAVTITNFNDNIPTCSPSYQTFSLTETTSTGITVASLSCSDGDAGTTLTYSFASGNTDTTFAVSTAGVVTTVKAVDYDTGTTSFTLLILVSDGTYSTTATVAVYVTAVNDNSPSFASNPTYSVNEDTNINTALITYSATDNDAAPHGVSSYAISSVTNSGTDVFIINPSTGGITLAQSLDYETTEIYEITVVVTDGGGSTATGTVTVSVVDVNDNTPICTTNMHILSVLENLASSSTVISDLSCSDSDSGVNGNLNYVITTNPGTKFSITQSGGIYSLTTQGTLDYETTSFYQVVITITDGGSTVLSTSINVQVNVLDVNEATPVFTNSGQYSATVSETEAIGATLVTIVATDADTADSVSYAFHTTYTGFGIDKEDGGVLLTQSLDYDASDRHTMVVTATDGTNTATATFSLTVTDVNEIPVFSTKTYSSQLDENEASGTAIVTVSAIDNDSGTGGTLTYSIASGDGTSSFAIDSSTGAITTAAVLDYETQNSYNLVIKAADGATPSLSATCLVVIEVLDKNDNPPVFEPSTSYIVRISEDSAISTTVMTIVASDADSSLNNNNVFDFSLSSVHPFSIGTTSGIITTNILLNREVTASYDVVILATDKGSPAQTSTYTLTVTLTDVNDNTPVITGTYDTTISEDTSVNSIVFTITASDEDNGDNAILSYNITSGDDDSDFKMDNNMIQIAKALDRETKSLYNLLITVNDNGATERSASISATVTISEVNEFYPTFFFNETTYNIGEDVGTGTTVLSMNVSDSDSLSNVLTYSIAGYWTTGVLPFTLHSTSGVLTTNAALDRETLDSYGLWLRVTDNGSPPLSSDINITITLDDINDNNPIFGSTTYSGSVTEGVAIGTSVMTLAATDADLAENAVVIYSIDTSVSGGSTAFENFDVDSSTGVIATKIVPDRETNASYSFIVNAVDNATQARTSSATVSVSVTDTNDNAPVFSTTFYNTEIPYLVTCSSSIATLTATDSDTGTNAVITYYLIESSSITFGTYFTLDSTSGVISLQRTVGTGSKYLMTFGARDGGIPQLSTSTSATVRIDTYTPDDTVIVFYMSISQTTYLSQETTFISQLTSVYQQTYPTCIVRRWCIEEVSTSSIKVNMYVISEDTTNAILSIGTTKEFLTGTTSRDLIADTDGTPKTSITGYTWEIFSITSIQLYKTETTTSDSTPWIESTEGIIILAAAGGVGLIVMVIFIGCIVSYCNKKSMKKPPPKVEIALEVEEIEDDDAKTEDMDTKSTSFLDFDEAFFDQLSEKSEIAFQPIRTYRRDDDLESFGLYRKPAGAKKASTDNKNIINIKPKPKPALFQQQEKKKPVYPLVSEEPLPYKVDISRFQPQKKMEDKPPIQSGHEIDLPSFAEIPESKKVVNRKFDGRAIDPVTGKVFEFNTKTNERRWMPSETIAAIHDFEFL